MCMEAWFCQIQSHVEYKKKWNPHKNSQAMKNGMAFNDLGEKSWEIRLGARNDLMLTNGCAY